MKGATVFIFMAAVALASAQQYTDRFDGVNVDEVIMNPRLLDAYIKCALEIGKCTAEGRELKSHIQDALENNCAHCTKIQRGWVHKVIGHLINNKPEYWQRLVDKYDPKRTYTVKYEKDLKTIKA
ncbi:allergen Tha p 1-like [Pararge aegeria]|nr:allergen Tha p 1-like [Pararge aegeria]